jgi:uncharacterized protein YcbK (DUF882 family)
MFSFEIYSIGDAFYLTRVLNAVAAMSGTADMRALAGVGFLVGVIITMLQSAFQAKAPQFQVFFLSLVIYMAMFGPSVTVTVEDVFTGDTYVVDNVPLGVAAVGSGVSRLGYGITGLFETAFASPSSSTVTGSGYVAPLTLLQDVRKYTRTLAALGTANYPDGNQRSDVARSVTNYLKHCPLYEIDRGTRGWNELMNARGWANAYASNELMPTTLLYLNGGTEELTCRAAWVALSDYITTHLEDGLADALAAATGRAPDTFLSDLNDALDLIAGGGLDARDYMIQSAFVPLLIQAHANKSADLLDWGQAAMISQSGQQRNSQWAAEQVLFSRYVHPIMTFFEAFMFAASPLMVFAIGLGPMGIKVISRYLVFGLWIQLWMPVLAITNLYTITGAQRYVNALRDVATANAHPDSVAGMWAMDSVIGDFLGTAGMLAASTPFITLMLIYGSAMTATALAGRLQGADHIDEKMVSPSLASVGPLMQQSAGYQNDAIGGTRGFGSERALPKFDIGRHWQRDNASKENHLEQAQQAFRQSVGSVAGKMFGTSTNASDTEHVTTGSTATTSAINRFATDRVDSITRGMNLTGAERQGLSRVYAEQMGEQARVTGSISLDGGRFLGGMIEKFTPGGKMGKAAGSLLEGVSNVLGGGGHGDGIERQGGAASAADDAKDGKGLGLSVRGGAEYSPVAWSDSKRDAEESGSSTEQATRIAEQMSQDIQRQLSGGAEFARAVREEMRQSHETEYTRGLSEREEDKLEDAAQDVIQAQRAYETSDSHADRYGPTASYAANDVAEQIRRDPQAQAKLDEMFSNGRWAPLSDDAARLGQRYARIANVGPDKGLTIARLALLTGVERPSTARLTPEERDAAADAGYRLISEVMGNSTPHVESTRNSGLRNDAPEFGSVQALVEGAGMQSPRGDVAGLRGTVDDAIASQRDVVAGGADAVQRRHALDQAHVHERHADALIAHHEDQREEALNRMITAAGDQRERPVAEHREMTDIDAHLREVRGELHGTYHLTDAQLQFYEAALHRSVHDGAERDPNAIDTPQYVEARERLITEEGGAGESMATILERAAVHRSTEDLGTIRNYNHHRSGLESATNEKQKAIEAQDDIRDHMRANGLSGDPSQGRLQFRDTSDDRLVPSFRQSLLAASAQLGRPLHITDGFREPNATYGAANSFHKKGMAADISMQGMSTDERKDLVEALIDNGVTRFAVYANTQHLHADVGGPDIHFMYNNGKDGRTTVQHMPEAPAWAQDLWRKYS